MSYTPGDYGDSKDSNLDTELSTAADRAAADLKFSNDVELANESTDWLNSVGVSGDYGSDTGVGSAGTSYTFDPSSLANLSFSKVSDYLKGNRGMASLLGGAGLAALGAGDPKRTPTIYQGGIPNLVATRNMISAPPVGRRPGAGGVDYGGDVTYTRAPEGQDPWVNLRGDSARIIDPQGQANVLKGTGGTDPQSLANKIGYNLPQGWSSYGPQEKIAWFNANNVTYDQLRAAGVPQSDIDYMWSNGYTSGRPANWGQTTSTGGTTVTTGGNNTVTTGNGIDALANAQAVAQTQADKVGLKLPSDWSTYDAAKKIDWYNSNRVTPEQLIAAGVDQGTIDWMMQNGYNPKVSTPEEIAPSSAKTQQSAGLMSAINQGMTQDQYIGNIKDWLNKNSTASDAEVYKQMKEYGIGAEDVASALGVPVSTIQGKINALTQQGDISPAPFIQPDSNLPPKVADQSGGIKDIMDREMSNSTRNTVGFREEDTPSPGSEGYQLDNQSAGLQSAIKQGMSEDQYIGNIKNWLTQNSTASDAEVFQQMQEYGIGADDVARALGVPVSVIQSKIDALGGNNYASGGMAQGRYLQGGTDGMADEIPAQIGKDQPAALSHGEFVIPADVVSHMGNGNSDAGAKKLYEMMDRIRMARTGSKEQGKKINPDRFMPGGLAKAYVGGGTVKNFATGGTTTAPAGVTGTQAGFSNWAGDYATNLMGQGQALANMPYQAYMGPLTAGPSALQNKVSQGLGGLNFPGTLGQSFTSAGAPTIGADGQPVGGGGIASSYMNPYLKNVLDPQLEELRRQSQINLQPGLAKLTQAGGYGGGRQAIMESEANRNLLNAQNTAIGTGYANAYDKAMQQFNTEQGQAKTLADMMASQGATDRAIEAEGVAADKAQFEEARANPFKMVQFQQSLLQGMPINAMDYTIQEPSTLQKVAQGVNTVDEMLRVLYGIEPAKKAK